jgi:transcriptional regulator GlxA family with amidase domain
MVISGIEGYISSDSMVLVAAGESHGFTSSKSNSRAFRRRTGKAPLSYRAAESSQQGEHKSQ